MTDANPATPAEGGPQTDKAVQFQELWNMFDSERFEACVFYDMTSVDPDPRAAAIAAHHRRRFICYEVAMVLIARIAGDDVIKQRLREIAIEEAREAALANPDEGNADDE